MQHLDVDLLDAVRRGRLRDDDCDVAQVPDAAAAALRETDEQRAEFVRKVFGQEAGRPEYYDLMFGGKLWRSASLNDSLLSSARQTLRGNVERIKRWQQQGLVAKDVDALRFSQVSWGTLHGISRFLIDGIYIDSASIKRICETAAEIMWQQLRPE